MKVRFAVQVLSRVSKSLWFCRAHLKLKQFEYSNATEEFILIMNDIFDLFNSNNKYCNTFYPLKNALSEENKEDWIHTFQRCEEYILGL